MAITAGITGKLLMQISDGEPTEIATFTIPVKFTLPDEAPAEAFIPTRSARLLSELADLGHVITCPDCGTSMGWRGNARLIHGDDGTHILDTTLG